MALFNKKEKVNFKATEVIYTGTVEYDANSNLLMIKNGFKKEYINPEEIEDIIVTCGQKTVSKKNLGSALAGAAVFGAAGLLLAGSHEVEYISNLAITVITANGRLFIPLTIGKVKRGNWLEVAEKIVARIEGIAK